MDPLEVQAESIQSEEVNPRAGEQNSPDLKACHYTT